jgi:hypothetical protein
LINVQRVDEESTILHSLHEGMRVRVISGLFRNLCGYLVRRTRGGWQVEFDCLPAGVSVIVPGECLEPIYLHC